MSRVYGFSQDVNAFGCKCPIQSFPDNLCIHYVGDPRTPCEFHLHAMHTAVHYMLRICRIDIYDARYADWYMTKLCHAICFYTLCILLINIEILFIIYTTVANIFFIFIISFISFVFYCCILRIKEKKKLEKNRMINKIRF